MKIEVSQVMFSALKHLKGIVSSEIKLENTEYAFLR